MIDPRHKDKSKDPNGVYKILIKDEEFRRTAISLGFPVDGQINISEDEYTKFQDVCFQGLATGVMDEFEKLFRLFELIWGTEIKKDHRDRIKLGWVNTLSLHVFIKEKHRTVRPSEFIKKLDKIINAGKKLIEVVEEFDSDVIWPAIDLSKDIKKFDSHIKAFKHQIHSTIFLVETATKLKEEIHMAKKEKLSDYFLSEKLFKQHCELYEEITGKRPKVYWDDHDQEYRGKFLLFCRIFRLDIAWTYQQMVNLTKKLFHEKKG